jgi:hypothetical protein
MLNPSPQPSPHGGVGRGSFVRRSLSRGGVGRGSFVRRSLSRGGVVVLASVVTTYQQGAELLCGERGI